MNSDSLSNLFSDLPVQKNCFLHVSWFVRLNPVPKRWSLQQTCQSSARSSREANCINCRGGQNIDKIWRKTLSLWLCAFLNPKEMDGRKKESKGQKIVGNYWLAPIWQKIHNKILFLKSKMNQWNGTKLIKGKYERPAGAVTGKNGKKNICWNPDVLFH